MRKLLAALCILAMSTPAFADYRHRPAPRQHYNHHRGVNPWVAGAVGLGVLGAGAYYYNRRCWDEMIGYDRRGREVWQRYCN